MQSDPALGSLARAVGSAPGPPYRGARPEPAVGRRALRGGRERGERLRRCRALRRRFDRPLHPKAAGSPHPAEPQSLLHGTPPFAARGGPAQWNRGPKPSGRRAPPAPSDRGISGFRERQGQPNGRGARSLTVAVHLLSSRFAPAHASERAPAAQRPRSATTAPGRCRECRQLIGARRPVARRAATEPARRADEQVARHAAARAPGADHPDTGVDRSVFPKRPAQRVELGPAELGPNQGQSEAIPHGSPSFACRGGR